MNEKTVKRIACIVMALFPALWGLFSFLNNTADFSGTAQNAVAPLLSMADTYGNLALTWRAITASWAPYVGLAGITAMETLAGILATIGVIKMIANIGKDYSAFSNGKAWAMLGALCAIAVWGIGFMVVAGDWFMAWQAKGKPSKHATWRPALRSTEHGCGRGDDAAQRRFQKAMRNTNGG